MSIIYEPKGRALEFSPLAATIYSGCVHGCKYCFVPQALRKDREMFHAQAVPRNNILERLAKDAEKMAGDPREILLSFSSDPYPPCETELGITREAIKILIKNNLRFTILTKGATRAVRDFDLLAGYDKCRFGTTLIFTQYKDEEIWEPNAPMGYWREMVIRAAYWLKIPTWVSLEPVIDPEQALGVIRMNWEYINEWKIGKLNYFPEIEKKHDWVAFREKAKEILDDLGANYYIKKSLSEL